MSTNHTFSSDLTRVVKGAGFNFMGALSRSLLGFIVVFVLAKVLSATDMGLFFLSLNILTFAGIIGIAGLDAGLRRFISISHGYKDDIGAWSYFMTAIAIAAPINLVLAILLFTGAGYLGDVIFTKPELTSILRTFTPYLLLFVAAEILLSVTQGYKHMKYWVICLDVLNNILRIVLALLFILLGFALFGVVTAYVVSILISTALAFYYFMNIMPAKPLGKTEYRFKTLLTYSIPVSLARLLNSGTGVIETIILGFFVTAEEVGIYTVALKIAAIGTIVLASLNTIFSPFISQLHAQNRVAELQELYKSVTRWAFSLSLPVFMLIAWFAAPIATLFGTEYSSGAWAIIILCGGQIFNAATGPSGNLLLMSGYSLTNLWINITGLILTVLLSVVLIPSYGVTGCAFAVACSVTLINIVRVILAGIIIKMHPYDWVYWKPVTAAILSLGLLALWGPDRDATIGIIQLLIALGFGMTGYFLILLMLGLNASDRFILGKIRQRLGI